MKNPNGYGCVKHLSGSRRNPFAFVVTDHRKQIVKGYFPTKAANHLPVETKRVTVVDTPKTHDMDIG